MATNFAKERRRALFPCPPINHGLCGCRGHRSIHEDAFADTMSRAGKTFAFEPHAFILRDGTLYIPDFLVFEDDTYYEVVSSVNKARRKRYSDFRSDYPTVNYKIVFGSGLEVPTRKLNKVKTPRADQAPAHSPSRVVSPVADRPHNPAFPDMVTDGGSGRTPFAVDAVPTHEGAASDKHSGKHPHGKHCRPMRNVLLSLQYAFGTRGGTLRSRPTDRPSN